MTELIGYVFYALVMTFTTVVGAQAIWDALHEKPEDHDSGGM